MASFIALLRGVNIGKAKRVPMAEFRALLAGLGYTGVTTLQNSGNAVFDASTGRPATHATDIASAITARLQLEVPVIVKSARELAAIAAENPLAGHARDPSRLLVAFTQNAMALARLGAIEALVAPPEQFFLGRTAAFLYCPAGSLESEAGATLLGKLGTFVTTRNWATVQKLHALAREPRAAAARPGG